MLPAGQFVDTCGEFLGRNRGHGAGRGAAPPPRAPRVHPHEIHRQFQRIAAAFGLDLIGAFLEVVAGNGPSVFPEQRANVQHAAAAAVQVGLVMTGEFLHAVAQVHQAEVARPDEAAAGGHNELAAAFEHVDAHVVEVGPVTFLERPTRML